MSRCQPGRRWLLAAVVVVVAGCGAAAPPPVSLSADFTASAGFAEVNLDHTRHAVLREAFAEVIDVYGVLLTPEWRTARLQARRDREHLSEAAAANLLAAEKAADAAYHEVVLLVTTHDRLENDLHRGERATWKVTLIDATGTEYPAIDVVRDRRPRKIIRAEFPRFGDFGLAYVARFPREAPLYGEGNQVQVRVASARGSLILTWQGR